MAEPQEIMTITEQRGEGRGIQDEGKGTLLSTVGKVPGRM